MIQLLDGLSHFGATATRYFERLPDRQAEALDCTVSRVEARSAFTVTSNHRRSARATRDADCGAIVVAVPVERAAALGSGGKLWCFPGEKPSSQPRR